MARIITGTAKNKNLTSPDIPEFRAVQEIAKSAVFSMLGESILGKSFLDLFTGSGNMGIEALSRGADWCDFVDTNKKSVEAVEKNLKNCNLREKAEIYQQEAVKFVANSPEKYDFIFVDPFYNDVKHKYLMELIPNILNPNGVVIFFHGGNLNIQEILQNTSLEVFDSRRYGKSYVDFLRKKN